MLSVKEQIVADAWMQHFGETLPVLGCIELAAQILRDYGVDIEMTANGPDPFGKERHEHAGEANSL